MPNARTCPKLRIDAWDFPIESRYNQAYARYGIYRYASVSTDTAVYIIGGYYHPTSYTFVYKFENLQWSHQGEILNGRNEFVAINVGQDFIILGDDWGNEYVFKITIT